MLKDNPARRLHSFLLKAFEISRQANLRDANSIQIWAKVFNVSMKDHSALLNHTTDFFNLIAQTREAIENLQSVRPDPYLPVLDRISTNLCQFGFPGGKWINFYNSFNNENTLGWLEAAANAIEHESQLVELTQEQLQSLLSSVEQLLAEVNGSELLPDIKLFLIAQLEKLCTAIRRYEMFGSEGLRQVIALNLGEILMQYESAPDEERKRPIWRRLIQSMTTFGGLLGFAADVEGFLLPKFVSMLKNLPSARE